MLFSEFIKQLKTSQPQKLPSLYIFTGPNKLVTELKEKALQLLAAIFIKDKSQSHKSAFPSSGIEIKRFSITDFNEELFWNEVYAVPFLNIPRMVVLNIADKTDFINKIDKSLAEYLSTSSFFTKLVIFIDELEKYSGSLNELINKKAWVIECQPLSDNELPQWISSQLNLYNKKISFQNAKLLADKIGNDLSEIEATIQKLVLFHKDSQNISAESICNLVDLKKDYDIKVLGDAIINKQPDRAIMIVNQLLRKGESVNKIIGYLRWFFSNKSQYQENRGLISYRYEKLLESDLAIKTGLLPDDLALQMLAIKLSCQRN